MSIIGATGLTKNFDTIIDVYAAQHSITSIEIQAFMENLLDRNTSKKVFLILDNARSHNCKMIQDFANIHIHLSLILRKIYGID